MGAGVLALHRARFAKRHELKELLSRTPAPNGVLLGMRRDWLLFKRFVVVRPTKTRRELGNLLIVAPTRGGKGLLATSQLLSWQHSVIVNDIKGDLFTQTAGYRATLGNVFVIDPTGIGHCYDPLEGKQTEDALYSAASHLLFQADEGNGAIFTQRATVMLSQLFAAAKLEGMAPLPYVRSLVRSGLHAAAARIHAVSPELATQLLDVNYQDANFTDRFLVSAWGTLTARMRPLLTETVVRCFTHSDFSNQGKGCQPVLLLIDEAGRAAIPMLADQATTVVGRGINLWIAVQSLSQLEAVYGKTRAQVLKDNMENQIYHRPTDLATANYLQERLGKQSAYAHSTTEREGAQTSEGQTEQAIPLLTAQDIMQLKDEEIICFHRRLPPFKITRMDWRQHPTLKQRRQIPPPQLARLPQIADLPVEIAQTLRFPHGYIDPDMVN